LSDIERKKLFVAMARAEIDLMMIMSERAKAAPMQAAGE
jgi:hypothetical protein